MTVPLRKRERTYQPPPGIMDIQKRGSGKSDRDTMISLEHRKYVTRTVKPATMLRCVYLDCASDETVDVRSHPHRFNRRTPSGVRRPAQ